MLDWIWKTPAPPTEPKPKHIPIEIRLHTEFNGDLISCAKWFAKNYKENLWSDLIMMQVLLIEEMRKQLESYPKK
jgi:hypothetical protein